jgi:hypothetical protein
VKHIGFTGTRHGMTRQQSAKVDRIVCGFIGGDTELQVVAHHGDCLGADIGFHTIARLYGCAVCVHPPIDKWNAANTPEAVYLNGAKVVRRPAKAYLDRNRDIVNESDVMVAAPYEAEEQSRGGTWSTVRYARLAGKPLAIVLPDGTVQYERWEQ